LPAQTELRGKGRPVTQATDRRESERQKGGNAAQSRKKQRAGGKVVRNKRSFEHPGRGTKIPHLSKEEKGTKISIS